MNYFNCLRCGYLLICVISLIWGSAGHEPEPKRLCFSLGPSSQLTINGSSNVNRFSCFSLQEFHDLQLSYNTDEDKTVYEFSDAYLPLAVNLMDCGKRGITRDLHQTLQAAAYPEITIRLKQAYNVKCQAQEACDIWVPYEVLMSFEIVGVEREFNAAVMVNKVDVYRYRCRGEVELHLSDFNIDPPKALAGLIVVRDQINVVFDLEVEIDIEAS